SALSDRFTRGTNHEFNFEATLAYKHGFAAKGHKLSSELRVVRAQEGGPNGIIARDLALDGTPSDTSALERQTSWEHPDEHSLRLDYVRPLSSVLRLEAGYRGSLQRFHTTLDTQVFDTAQAAWAPLHAHQRFHLPPGRARR